ncbi:MAG: LemA family protein [Candidatus Fimivicinus sp.]|nr:LemA family protein [Oscillospiraceae bacterium]MDY5590498.1 LemA family protein [Candidatus Fimivicinus sp.]
MNRRLKPWHIVLIVVAVLVVLLVGYTVSSYNGLVTLRQEVTQKDSDIQATLQRRADLIPNLVNTVKGYASHEESIMKEVSDARAALVGAKDTGAQLAANDRMTSALNRLLAIAENYPDLKANTNFIQLQDELAGTENRITQARRAYNDAVKTYNTKIQRFPTSLIAGIFNFDAFEYFQANENAQEVPSVNFD